MQGENHEFFNLLKKGSRAEIEAALADDPGLASARDPGGASAVLTAIYYGRPEIAALLIERGATLSLFEASAAGRAAAVLEILDGAPQQVNSWSPDGFQPLGLASFFGHTELAKILLERGAEVSANSRNPLNVQPLHSAVAGQHLEIARLLLEHGANPNARQGEGFTPLHGAAQNGQVEMNRLLLEHAADPKIANTAGELPAAYAQGAQADEITRLLGSR